VRSDHTVVLTAINSIKVYPDALRRVSYVDQETNKRFKFLTNNFVLPAITIARIYKSRWQVELFFKWIKQHLRIKAFYGLSENAVKTQIWIAVSVYVLVAIVRKRLRLDASLYQMLQILSLSLFEKMPILQALQPSDSQPEFTDPGNQLILFDL
jgi:transposase